MNEKTYWLLVADVKSEVMVGQWEGLANELAEVASTLAVNAQGLWPDMFIIEA